MIETTTTGVRVRVRAQPRASKTGVAGPYGGAVRIRIAAPPVDGEANAELIRFLAKALGVPRSAVRVGAGASGRTKTIEIDGVTKADVARALGIEDG
jgi:uncharacterized protein (TIGR00251 family)